MSEAAQTNLDTCQSEVILHQIADDTELVTEQLVIAGKLSVGQLLVVGTSTSEVAGKRIGTSGTEDIARQIFQGLQRVRAKYGIELAFQCCEHLNRALVIERPIAERLGLDPVTVIPAANAGGAMAAYAFKQMSDPCIVESIRAYAGIDIGDTLIGMHLRPVAVPVRPTVRSIGAAHVTMAYSRPKLIGGARAVYSLQTEKDSE